MRPTGTASVSIACRLLRPSSALGAMLSRLPSRPALMAARQRRGRAVRGRARSVPPRFYPRCRRFAHVCLFRWYAVLLAGRYPLGVCLPRELGYVEPSRMTSQFRGMVDLRVEQGFTVYQTNLRSDMGAGDRYWIDGGMAKGVEDVPNVASTSGSSTAAWLYCRCGLSERTWASVGVCHSRRVCRGTPKAPRPLPGGALRCISDGVDACRRGCRIPQRRSSRHA